MNDEMLSWLRSERDSMLALLRRLVEHESPSSNKPALDGIGRKLAEELEADGAKVRFEQVENHGNHLLAEVQGKASDVFVLLLGHMDTVWDVGSLKSMPFRVEHGCVHGPGAFDMKAGLVQMVFALRALRREMRQPAANVLVLINSDEEIGSHSSRELIEEQARRCRAVLVLEPSLPPDGRVKTFRKGVGVFDLQVKGRAAHAGLDPRQGASAIEELARQIQALHSMTDYDRGITVNVGTVQGGSRVNVVAAEARAEIDLRVSTVSDAKEMEDRILGLESFVAGTEVIVTGGVDRPPLERSAGVISLYEKAKGAAADLGFDLGEGAAGGGSDGNITAAMGVPTLDGLGAVGDGAHATHEHVILDEMPRRAALLARLLTLV
jgi:glutamate carboxypeptidase